MKKIICAMLALCVIACGRSDDNRSAATPAQQGSAVSEAEFNLNAEQFADAFNDAAKLFGQPFRIDKADIRYGAIHDYFEQQFSDGMSLTVGVSKETGRVTSVTALVAEEGGTVDKNDVAAISEVVAVAVNADLTRKKAAAMVADMLKEAADNKSGNLFPQRFINHVRYVLRSSSGIGYWWIASPV